MERTRFRHSRRAFLRGGLALAGLGLLSGCEVGPPWAGASARPPRLGWLMPNTLDSPIDGPITQGFLQGLHELGYVEGRNLALEVRAAEGHFDRLPALAAELAHLPLDVVFAQSTPGAVAAKNGITGIPVVFVATDPVGRGLISSLSRPGGNVTGLTVTFPGLYAKKLELLKEAVPQAGRIGYLIGPTTPPSWVTEVTAAAQTLALDLQAFHANSAEELAGAFAEMTTAGVEALSMGNEAIYLDHRWQVAELALRARLPVITESGLYAEAGCLMGHGPNYPDLYRRAATYVHKILNGAKPADLPVEQPTVFEFVVNLKTAQALGLTFPSSVLQQATDLIR